MPDYEITDPHTGLVLTVTGPAPPSEAILRSLFADAQKKTGTNANDPAYRASTMTGADKGAMVASGALPREQPHMGPVTDRDMAPVTFGDLIADPKGAVARMVRLTKQGLSDPRNYIPLAIGALAGGARAMGIGTGAVPAAAAESAAGAVPAASSGTSRMGAVIQAVKQNPEAAIDALPLGRTVKGIAKLASAARDIHRAGNAPEAPVSVPPTTPNTVPAPAAAPPVEAPVAATPNASADFPSLDELKLTPAEITTAVKWHEAGVSPETILHRILQSRQLTARTGTSTPDQAAEAVRRRNATGKWED